MTFGVRTLLTAVLVAPTALSAQTPPATAEPGVRPTATSSRADGDAAGAPAAARRAEAERRYRERLRARPPADADTHVALGRWCREHGLDERVRHHAEAALRRNANHVGARDLLGHRLVRGTWLPEDEAMPALGYEKYEGRWRLPGEIAHLRRARAKRSRDQRRAETADPERDAAAEQRRRLAAATDAALIAALTGPHAPTRIAARDELVRRALDAGDATLAHRIRATERAYGEAWIRPLPPARSGTGAAAGVGLLSVNVQKTDVLGIDEVPVSFGAGGTGRLQLPRTRSISIGTTVAVPLGIGR